MPTAVQVVQTSNNDFVDINLSSVESTTTIAESKKRPTPSPNPKTEKKKAKTPKKSNDDKKKKAPSSIKDYFTNGKKTPKKAQDSKKSPKKSTPSLREELKLVKADKKTPKKSPAKKATPSKKTNSNNKTKSTKKGDAKESARLSTFIPANSCVQDVELAEDLQPTPKKPKTSIPESKTSTLKPKKKPTYKEMLTKTIFECKNYTNGMTIEGLCKTLPQLYDELKETPFEQLRKSIRSAIQYSIKNNIIMQVQSKRSYKLTTEGRKLMKNKKKVQERLKKKAEAEKSNNIKEKAKVAENKELIKQQLEERKKKEAENKRQQSEERKKKEAENKRQQSEERKKQEAENKRLLLISKRKFPMDDVKLVQQDKELKVTPPSLPPRPVLPSLQDMFKLNHELVHDILQIYHIVRGDLGGVVFKDTSMPKFTLVEWFTCISKLQNQKISNLIPKLFHEILKQLLSSKTKSMKLKNSFDKLNSVLDTYSWPYVCYEYMKVMDIYLKSSELDGHWIYEKEDYLVYGPSPHEYDGYLGKKDGEIYKIHEKLGRGDFSSMSCNDIIALLKLLCDDLLADVDMESHINRIKEERSNMERNTKQCEIVYRRVKAGFEAAQKAENVMEVDSAAQHARNINEEGKEQSNIEGKSNAQPIEKETNNGDESNEKNQGEAKGKESKKFYTKEEYDEAKMALDKAVEDYDNACRTMITHTAPVGQDRDFRSYYTYPHDLTLILVEDKQDPNLFSLITCRSILDALLSSLDVRGIREHNLHAQLSSTRKHLHNDIKTAQEEQRKIKMQKEKEDLIQKLKLLEDESNNENIRRSSRATESEIERIKRQIQDVEQAIEEYKNGGTVSFLKINAKSQDTSCPSVTNHDEMVSHFANELIELESLWSNDLCMSLNADETFDKRKWKANLKNKSNLKNHKTCFDTLKDCLLSLEEHIIKTTNVDVYFKGYSTLVNGDNGSKPWEQKIQQLKTLHGHSYKKGKALLEEAIVLSPDSVITEGLKSALALINNKSIITAKNAALDVLQKHGAALNAKDNEGDEDDDSSVTSNEIEDVSTDEHFLTEEASILMLQRQAALILQLSSAAVDAEEDVDHSTHPNPFVIQDQRSDWISLVKSCNNLSMFAIYLQNFKKDITELVNFLSPKQEILFDCMKKNKSKSKKVTAELDPTHKLWTPVKITDDFVWVQWRQPFKQMISIPARICEPLHSDIASLLDKLKVTMYAPIGDDISSFCISNDDILVFNPKKLDDVKSNQQCEYWAQCMEIATSLYETEQTSS